MISGAVNELLDASVSCALNRPDGRPLQIEAILDTGFSGFLTLPLSVIESLRLTWVYRQQGMLADGRLHTFDVYAVSIAWDGSERVIEVEEVNIDPLIGMSLLADYRLTVEVRAGGNVQIERL
jgi:clan AA aspartic protease